METCWYCHWGWAKPVMNIYEEALAKLEGDWSPLHFGPAHVVWEDENFDCAEMCIETFDQYEGDLSKEELDIVKESLEKLAALPMKERCIEPEDYDDEHPELFPPTIEVVRKRRK